MKKTYYLVADEEPPERAVKSKNFIEKVMFIIAVARPCWDRISKKCLTEKLACGLL